MPSSLSDRASLLFRGMTLWKLTGKVDAISGLSISVAGIHNMSAVGDRLQIGNKGASPVQAEIIGFDHKLARAMAFESLDGIGPGTSASLYVTPDFKPRGGMLYVDDRWLGRIVTPLGEAADGKGFLPQGRIPRPVRCTPPEATGRARLGPRIDLGVRALNAFATCREGQRLGLFAGSGVGKSTLLAMLARNTACDVAVIALVGERGREVREFIEDDLGEKGLARSVVVTATSDAPPLMRREAALAAMTVAEHFRDQGKSVLLLMDSVTRYCQALREVGLSTGEPPATRGYPPSVFAELPRLLERAGPGPILPDGSSGQITALFTVLVEGDDMNEPVADSVRGILDGHIILDRRIGENGRYPAINILRSLSRSVPGCNSPEENALTKRARSIMATYSEMEDMIRLGAYRQGSDPRVDEAIRLHPLLETFLQQDRHEQADIEEGFTALKAILT
jgi:flagellum-specific ATP synthase